MKYDIIFIILKSKENNGRLDFLVNNCYAAVTLLLGKENKNRVDKFWEQDPLIWDTVSTLKIFKILKDFFIIFTVGQ